MKVSVIISVYYWFEKDWINGATLPTVDHLFELANLFQISVDDFLVGEEISKSEEKVKEEHIYGYSNYSNGFWGFCA